jgi:hypothetical protein
MGEFSDPRLPCALTEVYLQIQSRTVRQILDGDLFNFAYLGCQGLGSWQRHQSNVYHRHGNSFRRLDVLWPDESRGLRLLNICSIRLRSTTKHK